jgi:hypothetical protein
MATERLYQFPVKATPVPADIIYCGDSADTFNEVRVTIAGIIGAYPNLSGIAGLSLGANTYPYSNSSAIMTAGSISALGVSLLADTTVAQMQNTVGYTASPTASSFAGWDANSNLSANNFLSGYTTTATAAGTTTLTVASTYQQYFTGATSQTIVLPVVSTLSLGHTFFIVNNSSGSLTVQSSGGNAIQVMAADTTLLVTCILTSGTTAASWDSNYNIQSALVLPLSLANGGTNASLTASLGGIVYSTGTAMAILAGTATANLPLLSGSTAAPTWGSFALNLGGALTTAGAVTFSGAFPVTFTFTNTTGVTFPTSGTLAVTSQIPTGAALTKTDDTNVTLTLGGSPSTALLNAASLTLGWAGQLAVGRGGTGVSSVTTSPTASSFAGWDTNKNLSANSHINAFTTTATAAGTTTLTVASTYMQFFTGSTTQTVVLPVTSTLVQGQQFYIVNNSSGVVTVQSSGANTVIAMGANTIAIVTCVLTSGTTAASWYVDYNDQIAGGGTVTSVATSGLATGGTFTTSGTVTVTAAVQSDQETGTSTSVAVVPGVQQYHPSACKAWGYANGAGTSLLASYNVASITDVGVGTIKFNLTTAFSSTSFSSLASQGYALSNNDLMVQNTTSSSISIQSRNGSGSLTDPTNYNFASFGDQ